MTLPSIESLAQAARQELSVSAVREIPLGLIDPISGPAGTLEYDHGDGISITGGFVYRGSLIPELYGKYVFGDLALRAAPSRADGRLFYADLTSGEIDEFLLPQFTGGVLPNGLTIHGFGEDGNGELYALATNSPSSGTGGIVYAVRSVPEPESVTLLIAAGLALSIPRRRERYLHHSSHLDYQSGRTRNFPTFGQRFSYPHRLSFAGTEWAYGTTAKHRHTELYCLWPGPEV